MSKMYTLKTIQRIPVTVQEAWDFFSKPDNLKVLTPPHLGFTVLSNQCKEEMYAGQII
jgi:ligand-binding SRPBCC domain-containing protein